VYLSTAPKVIHNEVWPYISSKFRHFGVKNRSNGVKIGSKKVKKGAHFVMPILTFWALPPSGASARADFASRKGKKGAFSGAPERFQKLSTIPWRLWITPGTLLAAGWPVRV
jgi:hypothetical protein